MLSNAEKPKAFSDNASQPEKINPSEESNNSSQFKKKKHLSWKVGLSVYKDVIEKDSDFFSLQVPALIELYFPVSPSFEWLLQTGAGFRLEAEKKEFCDPKFIPDPPSEALADSELMQKLYKEELERDTNKKTCFKKKEWKYWYIPYLVGQTGFKYGSDVYAVLQGGATLSIEGDIGWTAEFIMGRKGLEFSGGLQAFSFKDRLYVGLVLYGGGILKNW